MGNIFAKKEKSRITEQAFHTNLLLLFLILLLLLLLLLLLIWLWLWLLFWLFRF